MKIVYQQGQGEVVEKKSRFIANIFPVHSEEEALSYIEEIRKKHYDARHNCFAYIIGEKNEIMRSSDDGEPSGTAGRPMLEVLTGEGLHDVLAVVTRYFGGTLLGTGGLVRAYSAAVKEGIAASVVIERFAGKRLQIQTDYNGIGKIQYLMNQFGVIELETNYTDNVEVTAVTSEDTLSGFTREVMEATGGKAVLGVLDKVYYSKIEGKTEIWTC